VALYFTCECGQDLRAGEERAGGRLRCPACGRGRPVPTLHTANRALGIDAAPARAAAAPMPRPAPPVPALRVVELPTDDAVPPRVRRATPRNEEDVYRLATRAEESTEDVRKSIDRKEVCRVLAEARKELKRRRQTTTGWRLETRWFQCYEYPMRAFPVVLVLGILWAFVALWFLLLLPETWTPLDWLGELPLVPLAFPLLGYSTAFLELTLRAGHAGRAGQVVRPPPALAAAVRGGTRAVVCFLAGPVVPVAVALYFWLHSGEWTWVDTAIVWELGFAAAAYWSLLLMAVARSDSLRDANPAAVARLLRYVGWRGVLAAGLLGAVVVGHGHLALVAVEEMQMGVHGWFLLLGSFVSLHFWAVLLLRWLGVSRYRAFLARASK
jgi:hypothetical protein